MILCSVAVALFRLCCVCDFAVASTALLLWRFVCFMLTALLLRCFGLESLVILQLFYCTSGIAWLLCSPWILDSHTSVYLSFPCSRTSTFSGGCWRCTPIPTRHWLPVASVSPHTVRLIGRQSRQHCSSYEQHCTLISLLFSLWE